VSGEALLSLRRTGGNSGGGGGGGGSRAVSCAAPWVLAPAKPRADPLFHFIVSALL
jgi:hypothetical protein